MPYYFKRPDDVIYIDGTVQSAVDKAKDLYNNKLTVLLTDIFQRASQVMPEVNPILKTYNKPTFVVQAWDAYSIDPMKYNWADPVKQQEFSDRFTEAQWFLDTWNPATTVLPTYIQNLVSNTDVKIALKFRSLHAWWITWNIGKISGVPVLSPEPGDITQYHIAGYKTSEPVPNNMNGDQCELHILGTVMDVAKIIKSNPNSFVRVEFDDEIQGGPLPGFVSTQFAQDHGIDSNLIWTKFDNTNLPGVVENNDDVGKALEFYDGYKHYGVILSNVGAICKDLYPELETSTGSIYHPKQFKNLDIMQYWTSITGGDNNPLRVIERVKCGQAMNRINGENKRIFAGPQIGNNYATGNTVWPNPPDLYSEGCWLAITHGSTGMATWGMQGIFTDGGQFATDGEVLWNRMLRLKKEVYEPLNDLLMTWRPSPARVAMWHSRYNNMWGSGSGTDGYKTDASNKAFQGEKSPINVQRAMSLLGEPFDVIYDEDILNGDIFSYNVIVVPCAYKIKRDHVEKLRIFTNKGGKIITHQESVLFSDGEGVPASPINMQINLAFTLQSKDIIAQTYEDHLVELSKEIGQYYPFDVKFPLNGKRVVVNLMTNEDKEYITLVNDEREQGSYSDRYIQKSGKNHMLDTGKPTSVTNVHTKKLQDILTNEIFKVGEEIPLEPGWGRVLSVFSQQVKYKINLPELFKPTDVVKRQISVLIDDARKDIDVNINDTYVIITLEVGDVAQIELVDIDNAGNKSEPSVLAVIAEYIPPIMKPAKPGNFTTTLINEEFE